MSDIDTRPAPSRDQVLKANRDIRDGNHHKPRRLDCGETEFRIPEDDFPALCLLYPGLVAEDHAEREAAWREFRESPIAEQYMVRRPPRRVRRAARHGNQGIIVR